MLDITTILNNSFLIISCIIIRILPTYFGSGTHFCDEIFINKKSYYLPRFINNDMTNAMENIKNDPRYYLKNGSLINGFPNYNEAMLTIDMLLCKFGIKKIVIGNLND